MIEYLNLIRVFLAFLGLIFHFIAHRYLSSFGFHYAVIGIGFVCQCLAIFMTYQTRRISRFSDSNFDDAEVFRKVFGWQWLLISASILFIFAQLKYGETNFPWLGDVYFVAWMCPLVLGLFWAVGTEHSLRNNSAGIAIDGLPIKLSSTNWFSLGLFFSALISINFVALKTDKTFDLSYFKTTKPGPATVSVVEKLEKPIEITGFFTRGSDVSSFVDEYLGELSKYSPKISAQIADKDFAPELAEKFRASANGQIVMLSDGKRQRVEIGDTLESARKVLRKLDELVLADLLAISSPKKVFYLMQGHGEMTWINSNSNPRRSLQNFQKLLRSFNYIPRHLSLTTGKHANVPGDATVVGIVGPSIGYAKNEMDALKEYVSTGGKLLILLDVEFSGASQQVIQDSNSSLLAWLSSLGIEYRQQLLVNDQSFLRFTRQKIDRAFLGTNNISAHESVASLSKNDRKAGLVILESGHIEITKINPSWKHIPTVRSLGSTFIDLNRNLEKDPDEQRSSYIITVASENNDSKIVTFADSTLASDPVLSNPGNQWALLDALKWLANEKDLSIETSSEEDIRIQHSKMRDLFVFHGAIYFLPALVLLVGFFATRRRRGN
jgi:hypothetical protein